MARIPAEIFHPSEYVAEEAGERGWTIWDVAALMGGDTQRNVLALQLYALRDPGGSLDLSDIADAFGVSAGFFSALEYAWRVHPNSRRSTPQIPDWYEIDAGGEDE